jgi:PST family polysaccharide transporter
MAAVVVSLGGLFADAGLGMAVVMHDQVTQRQVSNLFWANLVLGFALAALTVALSPVVAWFYGQDEIMHICAATSFTFIVASAGIQHAALLRRRLEFGRLTVVAQSAVAIGVLVGVLLARAGAGYWALVGQITAMSTARSVMAWILCPWRPSRPSRNAGTKGLVKFGGVATCNEVAVYVNRNIETLLIGRFLGADSLGMYNRSSALFMQIPLQVSGPFYSVASPSLIRVQAEPARFVEAYRQGLLLISAITLPIVALMFITAEFAVELLMGRSWMECVPVIRLLLGDVTASVLGPAMIGWMFLYQRRVKAQLAWTIGTTITKAGVLIVSLPFGLGACAVAVSSLAAMTLCFGPWIASKGTPLRARDAWSPALMPMATSTVAATATHCMLGFTGTRLTTIGSIFFSVLLFSVFYVTAWISNRYGRKQLKLLLGIVLRQR